MRIYKIFLVACIGAIALTSFDSCSKDKLKECTELPTTPCKEDLTKTNIRIKNISSNDYCNVIIKGQDGVTVNYGSLKSGETSCYNSYDKMYRYSYIKVTIDGEDFELQPIDFVGETPLEIGKFTYSVNNNNEGKQLTISTTKD
ncbi:MAG: hypothetical protein ABIP51_03070 [Bacteroidia bacterium]